MRNWFASVRWLANAWWPAIITKFRRFVSRNTPNTSSGNAAVGFVDVGGLDDQAADERERGERGQVGEQERAGVAGADLVEEHAGDADRGGGSGPEQRHGEHEREERAGDALAVVADGEQVAREREHEDDGDEGEWLPLLRGRDERGQGRGDREDDRLDDEKRCPSRQHQVVKTKAAKAG